MFTEEEVLFSRVLLIDRRLRLLAARGSVVTPFSSNLFCSWVHERVSK